MRRTNADLYLQLNEHRRLARVQGLLLVLAVLVIGLAGWQSHLDQQLIEVQAGALEAADERIDYLEMQLEDLQGQLDAAALERAVSRGGSRMMLSDTDIKMLAGTVYAEARGESELGKMLVARVALNRLRWNPGMTLEQILTRPNAFATGTKYTAAEIGAVHRALMDIEYTHLSGFHNPKTATNQEAQGRRILLNVGSHVFW